MGGGPFGEQPELLGGEGVVVQGGGGDAGAHQHQIGPEPLHDRELLLGPAQIAGQQVLGDGLEVAEGLEEVDGQAQFGGAVPDPSGDRGLASRSFSKISTPSKPAAAMAVSFSSRVPLRHTVAMDLRMISLRRGARAGR
ncbi:hypothetical protein SANT12839_060310 [Streptomyces antimycoticus]|uniref:Uncharacterized protein n=1 Tax=Streptomyces antimycoticus TaxID=68175 RepID=A0A4D4KG82_9ACTN|nr:hypothetical protein SANT12839_060310 [Streptomyces antimycoticus]